MYVPGASSGTALPAVFTIYFLMACTGCVRCCYSSKLRRGGAAFQLPTATWLTSRGRHRLAGVRARSTALLGYHDTMEPSLSEKRDPVEGHSMAKSCRWGAEGARSVGGMQRQDRGGGGQGEGGEGAGREVWGQGRPSLQHGCSQLCPRLGAARHMHDCPLVAPQGQGALPFSQRAQTRGAPRVPSQPPSHTPKAARLHWHTTGSLKAGPQQVQRLVERDRTCRQARAAARHALCHTAQQLHSPCCSA